MGQTVLPELELVSRQENENYATELSPPEKERWHIIENTELGVCVKSSVSKIDTPRCLGN
jgi:hypothetical protein